MQKYWGIYSHRLLTDNTRKLDLVLNTQKPVLFSSCSLLCDLVLWKNKSKYKLSWSSSVAGRACLVCSLSVSFTTLCAVVWQTLVPIQPMPPIVRIPLSPVCFLEVTSQALPHCTAQSKHSPGHVAITMCSTGSQLSPAHPALRQSITHKTVKSLTREAAGLTPLLHSRDDDRLIFYKENQRREWIHQMCGIKQTNGAWECSLLK